VSRAAFAAALVAAAGVAAVALVAANGPTTSTAPHAGGCTTTVNAGEGAGAIAAAIVAASDGATICLEGGSYPLIRVVGADHGRYVTVRPVAGATASVAGVEVADSSFLRFQGLRMTEGFNMRDSRAGASHDYQFIDDTFAEPLYGIVLYGGSGPIRRVLIEGNYMHHVHLAQPERDGRCRAGYATGQDVTIDYAEGVTIARNTFRQAEWHYIQGGSAGDEGVDVEHNLFTGRIFYPCSHLNIWQIFGGGTNDTFRDNIAVGEPGQEAATDGLIFENGPGSTVCADRMTDSVVENNLFVDAGSSYEIQLYTATGATVSHNTVVHSQYGTGLLTSGGCGAGSDYTMTHNIDVENNGSARDFDFGECAGLCVFDYNVSEDESARANGATHYVVNWSPSWRTTAWDPQAQPTPPAGWYLPRGLPFAAGYEGGGGP